MRVDVVNDLDDICRNIFEQIYNIFFKCIQGLGEGLRLARRRASRDRSVEGKLAEVVDR